MAGRARWSPCGGVALPCFLGFKFVRRWFGFFFVPRTAAFRGGRPARRRDGWRKSRGPRVCHGAGCCGAPARTCAAASPVLARMPVPIRDRFLTRPAGSDGLLGNGVTARAGLQAGGPGSCPHRSFSSLSSFPLAGRGTGVLAMCSSAGALDGGNSWAGGWRSDPPLASLRQTAPRTPLRLVGVSERIWWGLFRLRVAFQAPFSSKCCLTSQLGKVYDAFLVSMPIIFTSSL